MMMSAWGRCSWVLWCGWAIQTPNKVTIICRGDYGKPWGEMCIWSEKLALNYKDCSQIEVDKWVRHPRRDHKLIVQEWTCRTPAFKWSRGHIQDWERRSGEQTSTVPPKPREMDFKKTLWLVTLGLGTVTQWQCLHDTQMLQISYAALRKKS